MEKTTYLCYLIVFKSSAKAFFGALINPSDVEQSPVQVGVFDQDLGPALPPVWFCLHCPRTLYDVRVAGPHVVDWFTHFEESHSIVLVPDILISEAMSSMDGKQRAYVLLHDDSIEAAARDLLARLSHKENVIYAAPFSQINADKIAEVWSACARFLELTDNVTTLEPITKGPRKCQELTATLSLLMARVGNPVVPSDNDRTDISVEEYQRRFLYLRATLSESARLRSEGAGQEVFDARLAEMIEEPILPVKVPFIFGVPGFAPNYVRINAELAQSKLRYETNFSHDFNLWSVPQTAAQLETAAFRILVTHRSMSVFGSGGCSSKSPTAKAYQLLAKIEHHCMRSDKVDGKVVHSLLEKINREISEIVLQMDIQAMQHASRIDVFGNFPIGLATLPSSSAPLSIRFPMTYKRTMPLTSSFQQELSHGGTFTFFRKGFKVLVADCIKDSDPVKKPSNMGWNVLRDDAVSREGFTIEIQEFKDPARLARALGSGEYQVVVISAHGLYRKEHNAAGIMVWDTFTLLDDISVNTPLVILSSCHTCPRAYGVANIADLLIRNGAFAVLGTLIPVNAFHNAVLMMRFLTYISEAVKGSEPEENILEAWRRTAAGNAFNDILGSTKWMREFSMMDVHGELVRFHFMTKASKGQLRLSHIYEDTISCLGKIASEIGVYGKFYATIQQSSYFPETVFYQMLGSPERIYLQDRHGFHAKAEAVT